MEDVPHAGTRAKQMQCVPWNLLEEEGTTTHRSTGGVRSDEYTRSLARPGCGEPCEGYDGGAPSVVHRYGLK